MAQLRLLGFLLKSVSELNQIAHDKHDLGALVDGIAERVIGFVNGMDPDEQGPEPNYTAQKEKSVEPESIPGQFDKEIRGQGSPY